MSNNDSDEERVTDGQRNVSTIKDTKESLRYSATKNLRNVVSYLSSRYQYLGRESYDVYDTPTNLEPGSGKISEDVISLFQKAGKDWDKISLLEMNVIRGNVRANFEFIELEESKIPNLGNLDKKPSSFSTSLISPLLQTSLEIPRLFDPKEKDCRVTDDGNVLEFEITNLSQTSELYIPIRNPSGNPIRVRLTAPSSIMKPFSKSKGGSTTFTSSKTHHSVFVPNKSEELNAWWTGGSFFLADNKGSLMQSMHNVTIRSGSGAFLSLVTPSLHSSSAFIHGCTGRRCGYRKEPTDQSDSRGKLLTDLGQVTPIGAGAAVGEALIGHYYHPDGSESSYSSSYDTRNAAAQLPPFALGVQGSVEVVIPPFGIAQLGPVYFRPPSRKKFSASLLIENSLTGLESIRVKGRGGWEKVVFLDSDVDGFNGGDVENRFGKPTLVFPGLYKKGTGSVTKTVVIANIGDFPVEFDKVFLGPADDSLLNMQKPVADLHCKKSNIFSQNCEENGFRLKGCYDNQSSISDIGWEQIINKFCHSFPFLCRGLNNFLPLRNENGSLEKENNIGNGFTLAPNESRVLEILHAPDCIFSSMYVALNFEYRGRNTRVDSNFNKINSFQQKNIQLLLGYDLNAREIKECIPTLKSLSMKLWPFILRFGNIYHLHYVVTKYYSDGECRRDIFLNVVPFILLSFILFDIFNNSRKRQNSSVKFKKATVPQHSDDFESHTRQSNNWSSAYRCLSRIDPTSADLIHLGKEQTRQILLGRYKKLGILHPQCLLPNGTFVRENHSTTRATADSHGNPATSRRTSVSTLSDSIFSRHLILQEITPTYRENWNLRNELTLNYPLVPCGLGWREALRQGIISSSDFENVECLNGKHVIDLVQKRKLESPPLKNNEEVLQNSSTSARDKAKKLHVPRASLEEKNDTSLNKRLLVKNKSHTARNTIERNAIIEDLDQSMETESTRLESISQNNNILPTNKYSIKPKNDEKRPKNLNESGPDHFESKMKDKQHKHLNVDPQITSKTEIRKIREPRNEPIRNGCVEKSSISKPLIDKKDAKKKTLDKRLKERLVVSRPLYVVNLTNCRNL